MDDPFAGDIIQGTGGLRNLRGLEFWLFTKFDKNKLSDLSKKDRARLDALLKVERKMRNQA